MNTTTHDLNHPSHLISPPMLISVFIKSLIRDMKNSSEYLLVCCSQWIMLFIVAWEILSKLILEGLLIAPCDNVIQNLMVESRLLMKTIHNILSFMS